MRVFHSAYYLLVYHLSFFLFGLVGLALNVGCLCAGWLPATAATERFFQRLIHNHFRVWFRWLAAVRIVDLKFEGFDALPRGGGLVVVANHPGLLDATYLLARLPEAVCVFKPAIRRNPVLGAAARRAGYVASDGGHEALRAAAEKVAAGSTLIMFPEGTRSRGGVLQPFKPGFVLVARRAQAPIQLVRITADSPLLVKGTPWWRIPPLPARMTVTLGPCLPAPKPAERTETLVAAIEGWFQTPTSTPRRPTGDLSCAPAADTPAPAWQTAT